MYFVGDNIISNVKSEGSQFLSLCMHHEFINNSITSYQAGKHQLPDGTHTKIMEPSSYIIAHTDITGPGKLGQWVIGQLQCEKHITLSSASAHYITNINETPERARPWKLKLFDFKLQNTPNTTLVEKGFGLQ